ncbi:MAG: hypothetical protein RL292_157 [Candidatus Parcubacteria bacterium]
MKKEKNVIALFVLSVAGLLFSGYLSGIKFFTETCAFNESCSYFLGYPACYFGFGMFLALTVVSFQIITSRMYDRKGFKWMEVVGILGVLFAGYFTFKEIPELLQSGLRAYVLGLPTCALGLIFYLLITFISSRSLSKRKAVVI